MGEVDFENKVIEVTFDEINSNLEDRISSFADVFGSEKALEDTMKMSLSEIKSEYWEEIRKMMFIEKYRFSYYNEGLRTK